MTQIAAVLASSDLASSDSSDDSNDLDRSTCLHSAPIQVHLQIYLQGLPLN